MTKRTFLVTGASKGIGRALSTWLADVGRRVVGIARGKDPSFPGTLVSIDLNDSKVSAEAFADIARRHSFDVAVNNLGLVRLHRLGEIAHPAGARDAAIIQMRSLTQPQAQEVHVGAPTKTADATVVNGINVDDMFALIDDIKRELTKGKTNWHVITTWQGQTRSRAEIERYKMGREKVLRQFSIDTDEPRELGGSNKFANPQEHLIAALNACMTVGYVAQCAVRGITLESLSIETDGEIDLRGFLGIDPAVPPGYETLSYTVRIKGSGAKEQFAEVHEAVMATSPNFYNLSRAVALKPALIVE
jgi:NAD(P)-dependent dehydrogenase (short-subunit alcohol dehydrogenase family)